jgi:REP element-mobilizing transposase RayT
MLLPDNIYHIYNRANGSESLFREERNYFFFLGMLKKHVSPVADIFAWCLLDNHFHLMIKVKPEGDLTKPDVSKKLSNCFNAYTKAYNKTYSRNGSLFQRPFKKKEVLHQEYFTRLMLYIHNNAARHGFVNHFKDWPHSSWFQFETDENILFLTEEYYRIITPETKKIVFDWFGGKEVFISAHQNIPRLNSSFD